MHCTETLRELGYRLTPQRAMILAVMQGSDDHISAEEIHVQIRAKYPQVNISTVYRTLELLKGVGLVMESDLGEGQLRYHFVDKGRHHHLICQSCGRMFELDEAVLEPLKATLLRNYKFKASLGHFAIFGLCDRCAAPES